MPRPTVYFGSLEIEFIHPPRVKAEMFRLASDFEVRFYETVLIAPKGTLTDGASIPRLFWRVIGPPLHDEYAPAAVIHDSAYEGTLLWLVNGEPVSYTRDMADDLFRYLMEAIGVPAWKRDMMWRAVRWFGRSAWKANRK